MGKRKRDRREKESVRKIKNKKEHDKLSIKHIEIQRSTRKF